MTQGQLQRKIDSLERGHITLKRTNTALRANNASLRSELTLAMKLNRLLLADGQRLADAMKACCTATHCGTCSEFVERNESKVA